MTIQDFLLARLAESSTGADAESKRHILALHTPERDDHGFGRCANCREALLGKVTPPACITVRLLAMPYAKHPDYREEWKP